MKLEIKTSDEIQYEYRQICYAGVEYCKKDFDKCQSHKKEKWSKWKKVV
jgi:hypothetical protein